MHVELMESIKEEECSTLHSVMSSKQDIVNNKE